MDFEAVSPSEWFFILVHEISHKVDPILGSAVSFYSNPSRAQRVFAMAREHSDPADLSASDREFLQAYLIAGMDRGLLAEHRAWTASFAVYEAGLSAKLWKRIPWAEDILSRRQSGEELAAFIFRILDPHFTDPEPTGVFSYLLVQTELRALRQEFSSRKRVPPLEFFQSFVP